jgi:hypothetical protein
MLHLLLGHNALAGTTMAASRKTSPRTPLCPQKLASLQVVLALQLGVSNSRRFDVVCSSIDPSRLERKCSYRISNPVIFACFN